MSFVCSNCGYDSKKWWGRCPNCSEWNTFRELRIETKKEKALKPKVDPIPLEPRTTKFERIKTGFNSLDEILGGGIVKGSVILIGGAPGIGKSTLALQILNNINLKDMIYVSGEESYEQISMRALRLGIKNNNILVYPDTNFDEIIQVLENTKPSIVVVDSIQTVYTEANGAVTQIKNITMELVKFAKTTYTPVVILGHITKEGEIAGPKLLEHMVDCVLYFESESLTTLRILRTYKNRFGPSEDVAIFEMTSDGIKEASPSSVFLTSRGAEGVSAGSVMEGKMPLFIEVQALVSKSPFATPRRQFVGVDILRTNMLIAVVEKYTDIFFGSYDVFINTSYGYRIKDPACDLAICVAVLSSFKRKEVKRDWLFIGEVSLDGSIRKVPFLEERTKEALKVGFKEVITFNEVKNIKEILKIL